MSAFLRKLFPAPLRKHLLFAWIVGLACFVYMMMTDPTTTSLAYLLVPFVLFGMFVYEVSYMLAISFLRRRSAVSTRIFPLGASLLTVTLVLLQSLNQFTIKDAFILLVLLGVFCLYLWRADFLKN